MFVCKQVWPRTFILYRIVMSHLKQSIFEEYDMCRQWYDVRFAPIKYDNQSDLDLDCELEPI